jgi:SAM-dependent methyltransferase/uncharacterized protein YbaR (Trm112 family)
LIVLDELVACPRCRGPLRREPDRFVCPACPRDYAVSDGTPLFVDAGQAEHDELDHLLGTEGHDHDHDRPMTTEAAPRSVTAGRHKAAQSAYFDRSDMAEFEIERPAGGPGLYRFLLAEKVRRSLAPFDGRLDGWTALTVCGGSGMDAEFLAAAGARVISSDLSLGAAGRARERARRHRVPIETVVADIEHLPFPDRSVDLVYVHDGLHHLEDPAAGMAEMVRVARRAVCINEPGRAVATAIGVGLGLALDREAAGNRVARLQLGPTTAALEAAGLRVVRADRYAMYYHHVPGRLTALLSHRLVLPMAIAGWRLANRLVGRFGNKLTIVAVR